MTLGRSRQAAILEQQLPFGALDLDGAAFRLRSRLLARLLAQVDEGEGVPSRAETDSDASRAPAERWKYRVRSHSAEPVCRVAGVGFLAVYDAVPVTALGGINVLGDLMRLVPARKVKIQAGQRRFGCARIREQFARIGLLQLCARV